MFMYDKYNLNNHRPNTISLHQVDAMNVNLCFFSFCMFRQRVNIVDEQGKKCLNCRSCATIFIFLIFICSTTFFSVVKLVYTRHQYHRQVLDIYTKIHFHENLLFRLFSIFFFTFLYYFICFFSIFKFTLCTCCEQLVLSFSFGKMRLMLHGSESSTLSSQFVFRKCSYIIITFGAGKTFVAKALSSFCCCWCCLSRSLCACIK